MKPTFNLKITTVAILVFVIALCTASQVESAEGESFKIKELMSMDQFHEAGLDKLSDDELEKLSHWLKSYTLGIREMLKQQDPQPSGGVTSHAIPDVIETRIDGYFEGWEGDTIWKMMNGQVWQQSGPGIKVSMKLNPQVLIVRSGSKFRMQVEGIEKTVGVTLLSGDLGTSRGGTLPTDSVIETQIDGTFNGWDGETVWKMTNGQIWQQSEYAYHYGYAYRPNVTIVKTSTGYVMMIDGESERVRVKPLSRSPIGMNGSTNGRVAKSSTSLYDSTGSPIAYVETDLSVYLWSGEPVAYVVPVDSQDDSNLFGFNGKHLGWIRVGVVYDQNGKVVGAIKEAFSNPVRIQAPQAPKAPLPPKSPKATPSPRPNFTYKWSKTNFREFLEQGR